MNNDQITEFPRNPEENESSASDSGSVEGRDKAEEMPAPDLLQAALRYAKRGWPVFPLLPRDKKPTTKHGFKDATTDPEQIREWWTQGPDANIGIACGGELLVLDVDGPEGEASIAGRPIPPTVQAITGEGKHYYFQPVEGARNVSIGQKVHIRTDGGYVVAPPSVHPSGKRYSWAPGMSPDDVEVQPAPQWLVNMVLEKSQYTGSETPARVYAQDELTDDLIRYGDVALEREIERVANAQQGTRNDTLNRAAYSLGQLVGGGILDEDRVRDELYEASLKCGLVQDDGAHAAQGTIHSGIEAGKKEPRSPEPPGADSNSEGPVAIADSSEPEMIKTDPGDEETEVPLDLLKDCTDAGNAMILAQLFGNRLRYDHGRGVWFVWQGHWWQEDPDGTPMRLALKAAEWRHKHALELGNEEAARVSKWAIGSRNEPKLKACLGVAENLHPFAVSGTDWDLDPVLLGCLNGVIDLEAGELRDGKPEDNITRHVPHNFNPDAKCPRWESYLDEVFNGDEELIGFVQRAVGYTLTGLTTEQVFFVLFGTGSNGKSVFTETILYLMGNYATPASFDAFADRPSHSEALAQLSGKRMVTAAEVRENVTLNEQRVKAFTHGDTLKAAYKYGHEFEFRPCGKLWLATNRRPVINDDSLGFWRSVRLIPFVRQFLEDPNTELGQGKLDPKLAEALREEIEGILAWAVRGCIEWQKHRLGHPAAVEAGTEQWQAESDPLAEFVDECCMVGDGFQVPAKQICGAYQKWCDANRVHERDRLTKKALSNRMCERYTKKRIGASRTTTYFGIGLKVEDESKTAIPGLEDLKHLVEASQASAGGGK